MYGMAPQDNRNVGKYQFVALGKKRTRNLCRICAATLQLAIKTPVTRLEPGMTWDVCVKCGATNTAGPWPSLGD